jgi:hypothetical protein
MSAAAILFCVAAAVILVRVECALQKMTWRTWPPTWVAHVALLFGAALVVRGICMDGFNPGWPVAIFAAGAAGLMIFNPGRAEK